MYAFLRGANYYSAESNNGCSPLLPRGAQATDEVVFYHDASLTTRPQPRMPFGTVLVRELERDLQILFSDLRYHECDGSIITQIRNYEQ